METTENEFSDFDRLDYFILGILLHQACSETSSASQSVKAISEWLSPDGPTDLIAEKAVKLERLRLLHQHKLIGERGQNDAADHILGISIRGIAFLMNNADLLLEQIHGLTWDMPDEIEESLFELLNLRNPLSNMDEIRTPRSVSAANRYVSVKDNQPTINELINSLTIVKNEFSRDHNKNELPINISAITTEIESFEHQIKMGWISSNSARALLSTLKYVKTICVDASAIVGAVSAAIAALAKLLGYM